MALIIYIDDVKVCKQRLQKPFLVDEPSYEVLQLPDIQLLASLEPDPSLSKNTALDQCHSGAAADYVHEARQKAVLRVFDTTLRDFKLHMQDL